MELLRKIQNDYNEAQRFFETKYRYIEEARIMEKQIIPSTSAEKGYSFNPTTTQEEWRSEYLYPILSAILNKMKSDLTSQPARFEYEPATSDGIEKARVFEKIIEKRFTQQNLMKEYVKGLHHLFISGSFIAQPFTTIDSEKLRKEDGSVQEVISGRVVSFKTYDPLLFFIDPHADINDIQGTARYAIVNLGYFSPEWISEQYDISVEELEKQTGITSNTTNPMTMTSYSNGFNLNENRKRNLEQKSGKDYTNGIELIEYYDNKGMVYVVANKKIILDSYYNSAGIVGVPFFITPYTEDLDNIFGRSLAEELKPTIEVLSTVLNEVADIDKLIAKMPFFTFKGLIDKAGISLNDFTNSDIVELDPTEISVIMSGKTSIDFDIKKMIGRLEVQGVAETSQFLFNTALTTIWYLTGLSPVALSGYQDKQVRVSGVADIISNSSLRNSSTVVRNLETYFFNPMAKAFTRMFYLHYKDFPEFQQAQIEKEEIRSFWNLRIVNGSYLEADQMNKMQKAQALLQLTAQDLTFDQVKIKQYVMDAFGFLMQEFLKSPTQMLQEAQMQAHMNDANIKTMNNQRS